MHRVITYVVAGMLTLTMAAPGSAGDKKKAPGGPPPVERGPEHKVLESLVGTWDANVKYYINPIKPLESKGVMTRTMILGGNYLQESFQGDFTGKNFAGLAIIGYDYNKDKFMTTWCDSMSTSMRLTQGSFDSRKKTLTSFGEEFEPNTKKMMKIRDVLKIISADEQVLEMYAQPAGADKDFKIMEVHYTRKKPAKE